MTRRGTLARATFALLLFAGTARAQRASLAVGAAVPVGDYSTTAGTGIDLDFQVRTEPMIGPLALRIDIGYDRFSGKGGIANTTLSAETVSVMGDFGSMFYLAAGPGYYQSTAQTQISGHNVNDQRQYLGAGHLDTRPVAIAAPEQLVAAADRKQRRAVLERRRDLVMALGKVGRDQGLLAILPAAQVDQIALGRKRLSDADTDDLQLAAAPLGPAAKDGNIAAIGVDIELIWIEVTEPDPGRHFGFLVCPDSSRARAALCQYGSACPRSASRFCSSSIAV